MARVNLFLSGRDLPAWLNREFSQRQVHEFIYYKNSREINLFPANPWLDALSLDKTVFGRSLKRIYLNLILLSAKDYESAFFHGKLEQMHQAKVLPQKSSRPVWLWLSREDIWHKFGGHMPASSCGQDFYLHMENFFRMLLEKSFLLPPGGKREVNKLSSIAVSGHGGYVRVNSGYEATGDKDAVMDWTWHRSIFWLGVGYWRKIKNITLGIIGAGGLGNAFAILAMHYGFQKFILVDDDILEQSNLNRFIGATPRVTGKPKAHLLKKFMKDFNPKAMVKADISKFPHGKSMELLAECDIMVGCVDNDHSRLTLQLFSLALGKPLFDMGSGIYLSEGATLSPQVEERGGQVRIAIPGRGCLACMGLATSGIRDFNWQAHNKERGYIIGTGMTPPSVITLNQVVASLCLNSLVDYITGVGLGSFFIKYDEMNQSIRKVDFTKDPHCPVCSG